jgi:sulfhydrogenase subunit gamma (sulfur reductase)
MPGQFVELSIPGIGEAPFGFASSPLNKEYFELSIKRAGVLTDALHNLIAGQKVWIRGPFGNTFPVEEMEGSNLLVIGGGIGLAPLRPFILYALDEQKRDKYHNIQMLVSSRSSADSVYKRDFPEWRKIRDVSVVRAIDRPEEGWEGKVGFPNVLVTEMDIDVNNTYAILCGPPVMIKSVSNKILEMGFPKEKIYTTLEMRMTCGVGNCGKCNVGHQYVCISGPVFNMTELAEMPNEY